MSSPPSGQTESSPSTWVTESRDMQHALHSVSVFVYRGDNSRLSSMHVKTIRRTNKSEQSLSIMHNVGLIRSPPVHLLFSVMSCFV